MPWQVWRFYALVVSSCLNLVLASVGRPEQAVKTESHQHHDVYNTGHRHAKSYRHVGKQQHHRKMHRHQHGKLHRSLDVTKEEGNLDSSQKQTTLTHSAEKRKVTSHRTLHKQRAHRHLHKMEQQQQASAKHRAAKETVGHEPSHGMEQHKVRDAYGDRRLHREQKEQQQKHQYQQQRYQHLDQQLKRQQQTQYSKQLHRDVTTTTKLGDKPEALDANRSDNELPESGPTQDEEIEPVPEYTQPHCSSESYLRKQVVPTLKARQNFFVEGQPQNQSQVLDPCSLPRRCEHWASRASCCTSEFFESVKRREQEQTGSFELVKAQYEGLGPNILNRAQLAAKKHKLEGIDALLGSPRFLKVLNVSRAVTNFIDNCEDSIRLHFASMLCQLCDSTLERVTRQGRLMLATASCTTLAVECQRMPNELHAAGTEYGQYLRLLTEKMKEAPKKIPPSVHHLRDWLKRASIILRLHSKRISFYGSGATSVGDSAFCQTLGSQGHTYETGVWGYVAMLHLSNLAPAGPGEILSPDVLTLQSEAENLGYEKETPTTDGGEHKTHHKVKGKVKKHKDVVEKAKEDDESKLAKARVIAEEAPAKKPKREERACKKCGPHGQLAGSVCICDPCWVGECCEQEAAPGPYVNQPFEPLLAQNVLGSVQTLSVGGCKLPFGTADYQFARIKLHPKKDEVDHSDACKQRVTGDAPFRTLMEHVPVSTQETHYDYLIDVPIGYAGAYEVCYCFGFDCQHRTDLWNRIGTVQIAETAEQRADMVKEMRSPKNLLSLADLEPNEGCRTDWQLGYEYNIEFDASEDRATFRCKDGFEHLQGVHEMLCHLGKWRVLSTNNYARQVQEIPIDSEINEVKNDKTIPATGSAAPLDVFHITRVVPDPVYLELFNGQFPTCRKIGDQTCPEPGLHGLSKLGDSRDSGVVVTTDTEDGMAWHFCRGKDWKQVNVVTLIKGLGIKKLITESSPVLVPPNSIGEVSKLPGEDSDEFEITLIPTLQHRSPRKIKKTIKTFELIMMQTPFKQACTNGSWLPQNVLIRCAQSSEFDWGLTILDAAEAQNELGVIAAQQKRNVEGKQALPASSSALQLSDSLGHQAPTSMLELGSSRSNSGGEPDSSQLEAQSSQLEPMHWPAAFSNDGRGAFHVDSCWISHFNCSDGSVALDTSTGLHLNEVPLRNLQATFGGKHPIWKQFPFLVVSAMMLLVLVVMMARPFKSTDKPEK